ncbi:MAG: hypothetical protein C1941_07370 [Prosthecochloris sp.]|nr:hypothetical protein [Prosthecochloris sp.]
MLCDEWDMGGLRKKRQELREENVGADPCVCPLRAEGKKKEERDERQESKANGAEKPKSKEIA